MATAQNETIQAPVDPFADGPPPEQRRAWLRAVLETVMAMSHDDYTSENVREVAKTTRVPYLLLALDYWRNREGCRLTPEDIAAWNADPEAQQVLADWWATEVDEPTTGDASEETP